ncbi:MAG: hypothetical protein QNI90_03015 [Dinoroseobacter sp.]|nr:hypothetical protein [Dinoroseobacter sp.]
MALALQRCGRLEESIRNDWFVVDEAVEEYFFDTGKVGEALVELDRINPSDRYAVWILGASNWIEEQVISVNFNYNAFPANFHSEVFRTNGDAHHLDLALDRLLYGVLPGMISAGEDTGHWVDPHNERIVYRTIMLRAMIETRRAMTLQEHDRSLEAETLEKAISASLQALERQMRDAGGIAAPGLMVEIYLGLDALSQVGIKLATDADVRDSVFALALQSVVTGNFIDSASTGIYLASLLRRG